MLAAAFILLAFYNLLYGYRCVDGTWHFEGNGLTTTAALVNSDPEDTSVWADRSRGFSFFSSFSVRWLGAVWLGCAATCSEVGSGSWHVSF